MKMLRRYINNPIMYPNPRNWWEGDAVFNPSVVKFKRKYIMLYRAITLPLQRGINDYLKISVIGYAESKDGINFKNRKLFLGPEYPFEAYSTEDPRVIKFKDKYYIFYTAVSKIPPKPKNVREALAITEDFKKVKKEGIICPYNSKAAIIFPKKYEGKYVMLITLFPDLPPSKVLMIYFDSFKDLKDREFWDNIVKYPDIDYASIILEGKPGNEFVEVGSNVVELDNYWLLFVPDIIYKNGQFYSFRISAILLDKTDPSRIVAYSKKPLLIPTTTYETSGRSYPTTDIAFPTAAIKKGEEIYLYYGASDRFIALAFVNIEDLINFLLKNDKSKKV